MFFTIPNFMERMLEQPLSGLTLLSLTAIITTISLFFCGIPICMQIYRRGSTHEISGFPFLMGFLGGTFWLRYGLLKSDLTMVTVNVVGVALMSLYLLFYLYFSRPRTNFLLQLIVVCATVLGMLFLVHIYALASLNALGFVCMTFNILNFGAPLAGLRVVLRNRNCSTLPLPLCIANLLVSSQWCLYGFLVNDIFIIIPNGAGMVLALIQIALFMIFPRKHGRHAPLSRVCPCLIDLERGDIDDADESPEEESSTSSGNSNGRDNAARKRKKHQHAEKKKPRGAAAREDNQFMISTGRILPRNNFLNRQRVIDKRMIPQSRAACIEYLRTAGGGTGAPFDASFGSVSSRATDASWISNGPPPSMTLSQKSCLSSSHPELYAPVTMAPPPYESVEYDSGRINAEFRQGTTLQSQLSSQPSTSLLPPVPNSPTSGRAAFFVEQLDEWQPLTQHNVLQKQQQKENKQQNNSEDAVMIVRTLSAPDLISEQEQKRKHK